MKQVVLIQGLDKSIACEKHQRPISNLTNCYSRNCQQLTQELTETDIEPEEIKPKNRQQTGCHNLSRMDASIPIRSDKGKSPEPIFYVKKQAVNSKSHKRT